MSVSNLLNSKLVLQVQRIICGNKRLAIGGAILAILGIGASIIAFRYYKLKLAIVLRSSRWITPKEQFTRLELPIAKEVSRETPLILDIAKIVALYTGDELDTGDKPATHWYTALERLGLLSSSMKIPPLPLDIHQILDSECPIYAGQVKPDGTPYKILIFSR
jgi:hypothetical protein